MQCRAPFVKKIHIDKTAKATDLFWLGSGGFLLISHGTTIVIDPVLCPGTDTKLKFFEAPPITPKEIEADIVLYTHNDEDHLGAETAQTINTKLFGGTPPCYESLTRMGIPPEKVLCYRDGKVFQVENITIEVFPADHPWQLLDPVEFGEPFRSGDACGYIITTPDARIYFPGDTRLIKEHYTIKDIDLFAMDVGTSEYHLGLRGAAIIANQLPNAYLLPNHYGTYDAPTRSPFNGDPAWMYDLVTNCRERMLYYGIGQRVRFINHELIREE